MFTLIKSCSAISLYLSPLAIRRNTSNSRALNGSARGEAGVDWIHQQAAGWPHLVQLLADTVVDLVNKKGITEVDDQLLENAADEAIVRGDAVLRQLLQGESTTDEWSYLRGFITTDELPVPHDSGVISSLKRRWVVKENGELWQLRVPLMLRWLRKRS